MKLRNKILWLSFGVFIIIGCATKRSLNYNGILTSEDEELKYSQIFISATRHGLFGNNKAAIREYEQCLSIYPERAAPFYQLSSIYLKNNLVGKALFCARKAVQLDSSNTWYRAQLANVFQYTGQIDSAIVHYNYILKLKNSDDLKYNLAMLYLKEGMAREAINVLNKLDVQNADSKEIMLMKHNIYHNNKNYDSALYWLNEVTLTWPEDVNAYGMLAEYLTEIGRFEKAKEVYKSILEIDSVNGLVFLSFAEYYVLKNKPDSARIYYKKAFCESDLEGDDKIDIAVNLFSNEKNKVVDYRNIVEWMDCVKKNNRKYSYYAILIDISIKLENFERAKVLIDSALLFKKDNYMLWEQALLVNNYLGNDNDVVRLTTEAITYFPDKHHLFLVRSYANQNMKNFEEAIINADSLLKRPIENNLRVQGCILLGELYRSVKNNVKSDYYFEEAIKLDENNLLVKNNYAYYLAVRGEKMDLAIELSKSTLIVDPANPTYLDTYGWIMFKKGDYIKAKEYVGKAIRNGAHRNIEVLEHYGDIMLKLKKCDEALEAFKRILDIDSVANINDKIGFANELCEE